jgi:hypothetical protein
MDNQALSAVVRAGSPLLSSILISANAELARAALGKALVDDDQAAPDDIAAAISKDPANAPIKIQQAEQQFLSKLDQSGLSLAQLTAQVQGKRLDVLAQLEQTAQVDRQSARQRQIDTHDRTNSVLAYAVTAGFFIVLFALLISHYFPCPAKDCSGTNAIDAVLQTMLGILGTAWVSIITFYFGSSIGSKEKTALLAEDVSSNNSQAQ